MTPADERRLLDLVNTAVAFQKQGDLAGAILNYKKAVAIYADHPVVLSNLGNALRAQGKAGEAVSLQKRAAAIDPANAWFLLNLYEAERDAHLDINPTLRRVLECPTVEIPTKMWAAITLGESEQAFAFTPPTPQMPAARCSTISTRAGGIMSCWVCSAFRPHCCPMCATPPAISGQPTPRCSAPRFPSRPWSAISTAPWWAKPVLHPAW